MVPGNVLEQAQGDIRELLQVNQSISITYLAKLEFIETLN
jgi:hypothetical protein|tara:strand:+ start:57 stop:176 length:120 start_codon:yes stop_codon:yes gene_type:complete